jgi:TP901 family phage tail tape measure protein
MADLNKTVQIIFGATDKTGNVISGVSNNIGKIASPVADLTKKFLILEGAIVAVGVALAVKAFKESSKFEGALLDLQKVMSDSEGAASQFTGAVDILSNKYGEASTDILQGAANFKQAGFTVKESFELQKAALDLVVAGDLEAAEASELLVSTLKGFEAPASEAARLTDILNEVSNKYATNLKQLGIGMAELSPIAKLMGFNFEETAGVLTPIIEVFRSGGEAAVALKTGLLRLISDQKPVQAALKAIGVSQKDYNGKLRSGKDILFDVAKAFKTLDKNQKLFITGELVGIRQAGKMVKVFDGLSKSLKITRLAYNSAGSVAKEVNTRLEASEKQVDRAKVAFDNMARSIGDQFRPELTGVIGSITDFEIALQGIVTGGGFETLLEKIRPQLKEWEEVIGKIAVALPEAFEKTDFTPILDALGRIDETFDDLFTGLDLTKPEDLAILFNRIIEVGGSMIDVTAGIVKVFGEVGGIIIKTIRWFSDLDPKMQKTIGSVGGVSVAITTLLLPALGLLGIAMTGLSLKFATMAGARGVGAVITALTGAAGLGAAATTAGVQATTAQAKFDALFTSSKATKGIGSITKALGKAGLVAAIGLASFEAGKLIEKFTGLNKLFRVKDVKLPAPTKAEQLEFETKARAARKEVPVASRAVIDGIDFSSRINADRITKAVIDGIDFSSRVGGDQVAKAVIDGVDLTSRINTNRITKAMIDGVDMFALRAQTETERKLLAAQALPGAQTEEEQRSLNAILKSRKAMEEFGIEIRNTKTAIPDALRDIPLPLSTIFGRPVSSIEALEREAKRKGEISPEQKTFIEKQNRIADAQLNRLTEGEAIINITGDGLEPELEAFMFAILERVQIRANAEGAEYLLGVS